MKNVSWIRDDYQVVRYKCFFVNYKFKTDTAYPVNCEPDFLVFCYVLVTLLASID